MTSESSSVLDRISEGFQQMRDSGELIETQFVIFKYPFLSDKNFHQSFLKDQILKLNFHEVSSKTVNQSKDDLDINKQITITTTLPRNEQEKRYIIPSLGIGGRALSPTEVGLYFDLSNPNVIDSLKTWKSRQIGHELNHIARMQTIGFGRTLLDNIIAEGLATFYEEHWGGEFQSTSWGHNLSDEKLNIQWALAKPHLNNTNYNHQSWFFGYDGEHPVHTGYSLGTRIIENVFEKHPAINMKDAVRMKSKHLLRLANFG